MPRHTKPATPAVIRPQSKCRVSWGGLLNFSSQENSHIESPSSHAGIRLIKDLANAIDELTSVVVEKAERVNKNPGDRRAKEELDVLRRKWASKVQELTQVIDDIIDPEDFMAQSGGCGTLMGCT